MITANGLIKLGFTPEVDFSVENDGRGNSKITWWKSNQPQPTEAEIETADTQWQAEYDSLQYQRDRAIAYPSLQDQADMQYWDAVNGTTTWQDAIAKVKADYPKG